jgi:1-deoxyxylulose-5-phosphate synthase
LPPLISVQHHYNPVWREDERFLVPLCEAEGVGMVAYSPLGRGFLAGAARGTTREKTDDFIGKFYGRTADLAIQGKIEKLAEKAGVTPAQLSLLWVLRQRYITSAVVGPTNSKQLSELVQCTETRIADDVFDEISATYSPRMEVGHG